MRSIFASSTVAVPSETLRASAFFHEKVFITRLHLTLREAAIAVITIGAASTVAIYSQPLIGLAAATLLFALGVILVGASQGLAAALLSALLAFLIFNFFLAEPFMTLSLASEEDLAPLIAFNAAALIAGALAGQLRDRAAAAERAQRQLQLLLDSSNRVQSAITRDDVVARLLTEAEAHIGLHLEAFEQLADGSLPEDTHPTALAAHNSGAIVHDGDWTGVPMIGSHGSAGALLAERSLEIADDGFLDAYCNLIALALERADLSQMISEATAAARSEQLKSALLSSVSHDFRTPLATISASASSLLSYGEQLADAQRTSMLRTIVDECDRLDRYTANLLELSKLQAGEKIEGQTIDAVDSVGVAVSRVRDLAIDRSITVAASGSPLFVRCNAAMFDLVLLNVLTNSIIYSEQGTAIEVHIYAEEDEVAIDVRDEGLGIPAADLETAFHRFRRVERMETAPKGSGLGLAIAKGFVEAFDGRIWAATPGIGTRGTLIAIRLPRAQVDTMDEN